MGKHLLLIESGSFPDTGLQDGALNEAFVSGAQSTNWNVHRLDATAMRLRSDAFDTTIPEPVAAKMIRAADRLAIIFPLHCSASQARMRALLDRAESPCTPEPLPANVRRFQEKKLQFIVTMELPAFMYRQPPHKDIQAEGGLWFGALPGFAPPQITLVGGTGAWCEDQRVQRLRDISDLGAGRTATWRLIDSWSSGARAA